MNTTLAYLFVSKEIKTRVIMVWEFDEIKDMMKDDDYVFIGTVDYDTVKLRIV